MKRNGASDARPDGLTRRMPKILQLPATGGARRQILAGDGLTRDELGMNSGIQDDLQRHSEDSRRL